MCLIEVIYGITKYFGHYKHDELHFFYQLGDNKHCKKILHIVVNRCLFVLSFQIRHIYIYL
jgi:hypothetical protein